MKKLEKKEQNKQGLTLIGILISMTVMSVGIASLLALTSKIMLMAVDTRHKIEATALMYDAFEIIRGIRDNNLLTYGDDPNYASGEIWDCPNDPMAVDHTPKCFRNTGVSYIVSCGVDSLETANPVNSCWIQEIGVGNDYKESPLSCVSKKNQRFIQSYSGSLNNLECSNMVAGSVFPRPKFHRYIYITALSSNLNLKRIEVVVSWEGPNEKIRSVSSITYLGNWATQQY